MRTDRRSTIDIAVSVLQTTFRDRSPSHRDSCCPRLHSSTHQSLHRDCQTTNGPDRSKRSVTSALDLRAQAPMRTPPRPSFYPHHLCRQRLQPHVRERIFEPPSPLASQEEGLVPAFRTAGASCPS